MKFTGIGEPFVRTYVVKARLVWDKSEGGWAQKDRMIQDRRSDEVEQGGSHTPHVLPESGQHHVPTFLFFADCNALT